MYISKNPGQATTESAARNGNSKSAMELFRAVMLRHYRLVIGFTIATTLAAGAYLWLTEPVYTASATLMIDARRGGIQQTSILGDAAPGDSAWLDSEIGMLILERPKIGQAIAARFASETAMDAKIRDDEPGLLERIASAIKNIIGVQVEIQNHPQSDIERIQSLAAKIGYGLDIKRVGFSYLVNVNFSSNSPEFSTKVANAAADAYVTAEMQAKDQDLRQASDWLEERYQTLRDQASAAERAVVEFKNKHNIVTPDGRLINDQQLIALNAQLTQARTRTVEQRAKLDQIQEILGTQEQTGEVDSTVSEALQSGIINVLRAKYLEVINKEADWAKRFGPNHLAVVALRNQARDLRNEIHDELKRIAEGDKSDYEIAVKNEDSLAKQVQNIIAQSPNDAQITLRSLEATAQSYRTFYDNFFLHYTESIQQQSSPIPDTRVISYAPFAFKTFPSPFRIMALSVLGGIALGFGAGFLREKFDRAFRTGVEVEDLLQRGCVAMIPLSGTSQEAVWRTGNRRRFQIGQASAFAPFDFPDSEENVVRSVPAAARTLIDDPFSRFAETIRALKMSADTIDKGPGGQVIGFTSSLPQEGKSTVAVALAGLAGLVGARVLLVDGDLRKPSLSLFLAPGARQGLLEVMSGEASIHSAVWREPSTGIDFLPAVNVSGLSNTAQILSAAAMRHLFASLRTQYDYIIVDLSPLLPVVDVRATVDLIDFYFYIIEWGRTPFEIVRQALNSGPNVYQKVLGFALNKVDQKEIGRHYFGETYGYGYGEPVLSGANSGQQILEVPLRSQDYHANSY